MDRFLKRREQLIQEETEEAAERAQRLRVHTACTEDTNLVPNIHVKGLRTTCNSSSGES